MKTVTKALSLLQQFVDTAEPKSLGAIAAKAGLDKATTRRMLLSMCNFGVIEQNPDTRAYSLGPAVLPLARAREAQRPLVSIVEPIVRKISTKTGETTHLSVPVHNAMSVLCVAESAKAIRAHVKEGSMLPLHTSGAGIAFLSACDEARLAQIAKSDLSGATPFSYTTAEALKAAVKAAQTLGYAFTEQTFEEDVCGISVPVFQSDGKLAGTIGVATPLHRMTARSRDRIVECLKQSAAELSKAL